MPCLVRLPVLSPSRAQGDEETFQFVAEFAVDSKIDFLAANRHSHREYEEIGLEPRASPSKRTDSLPGLLVKYFYIKPIFRCPGPEGSMAIRDRRRVVGTAKTVKRPRQQPAHPQCANYWAPLTRKRHTMPHSAQPQHTNHWAPRTRKRHQQEHRPQRPTEHSDPTQHAKGRTGDCPGPRKETRTRRNVTQGHTDQSDHRWKK